MAKQSGLHQLRGKVGEHSYYRQTGVSAGLVRSINQGMSARVKTGEEYANTRLNNAEFGQACSIAGVLGKLIVPKFRPMILPFSQSKMAKLVLEAIKTKTGNWGQRNLSSTDIQVLLDSINSVHKNDPSEFGFSYSIADDELSIQNDETRYPAKMAAIGADGVNLVVLAARPWFGTYNASAGKYAQSHARANIYEANLGSSGGGDVSIDYAFPSAPPTGWPAFYVDFFVVVIMPFRLINGESHTLQEYCTFQAIEVPDAA